MNRRRVCITGIGIVSPLGNTREETWQNVLLGKSGADYIKSFDAETWPTKFACEVKNFQLSPQAMDAALVPYLHRAAQFGVEATYEAMQDSGIAQAMKPDRFGISVGANIGAISPLELYDLFQGTSHASEPQDVAQNSSIILRNHPGTFASALSAQWRVEGAIATTQTACASSGQSLGHAYRMIMRGDCDAMITGGADSLASELLLAGFCLLGALSKRNDDPKGASRPFDKDRDGFVAGEGAAMLILEELDHALARKAKIYAEIVGYGETESAYRITDLPPDGRGIVEAMQHAILQSGLSYRDVHYINAHGTSTEVNDRIEALGIQRVFGEKHALPLVSSTKSETGHLISAAGALELSFCALAIRDKKVPPTRNLKNTDCDSEIDFVAETCRDLDIYAAMSNSIGFGGSNSSILIRRWEAGC